MKRDATNESLLGTWGSDVDDSSEKMLNETVNQDVAGEGGG